MSVDLSSQIGVRTYQETVGEYKVGITFNPSNSGTVNELKTAAAQLIDLIDAIPLNTSETGRLKALAITAVEEGAMWAVKSATKQERK